MAGGLDVVNHSFGKPDEVIVRHMDLNLYIDFDEEKIRGSVTLKIENKTGTDKLHLDTNGLVIKTATLGLKDKTSFELGDEIESLGQPLIIDILPETKTVTVHYETTAGATALDWLKPEQTAGGEMPFLYTQGQAILNRTWMPCQDSPDVRITYGARITVPKGMMAVMSASNSMVRSPDGVYSFSMPQPIPVYLIALAVGDLEFRPISERCGVYAEPYIVDRAAWEFADTESMIQAAEALYGPYRWDRYDVIVLPPSFPYGGMENPRLSFVTPVLVAGDRSLVSTIAHELAHSWSGNLVTNSTWDDFWLNEGFTVYFERRIMEEIYGRDDAELDAVLGVNELNEKIEALGVDHPDTRLALDLSDRNDPEDGPSTVAYNKGYLFLRVVEESVGRERMDAFLRKYFDTFAFKSMTSEKFVEYLRSELIKGDKALEEKIMIDEWVFGTGMPSNTPAIRSLKIEAVEVAISEFEMGTPPGRLRTNDWSTQEWKLFLQGLPEKMPLDQMASLDNAFGLTEGSNGELQQVWFLHAIESDYEPAYPQIEDYLVEIGRIWLIGRVYRKLAETPEGLERAKKIYVQARSGYHPVTQQVIDGILKEES